MSKFLSTIMSAHIASPAHGALVDRFLASLAHRRPRAVYPTSLRTKAFSSEQPGGDAARFLCGTQSQRAPNFCRVGRVTPAAGILRVTDPTEPTTSSASTIGADRCEPRVEDEAVIVVEVDAFLTSAGADLQALHAAVTRFVVHCRERGEPIERIISTLKLIIVRAVFGTTDARAVDSINKHLLGWVLDAYYTRED
jgi:hypothetical protein